MGSADTAELGRLYNRNYDYTIGIRKTQLPIQNSTSKSEYEPSQFHSERIRELCEYSRWDLCSGIFQLTPSIKSK